MKILGRILSIIGKQLVSYKSFCVKSGTAAQSSYRNDFQADRSNT